MTLHKRNRPKVVVFAGAGMSAPLGIPTMDNFADRLRDSGFLDSVQYADMAKVQLACNTLAATIGVDARNLEHLASFLSMLKSLVPEYRFPSATKTQTPEEARKLLCQAIAYLVKPHLDGNECSDALGLMGRCHTADISFVTTNYDLHLEFAAIRAGFPLIPTDDVLAESWHREGGGGTFPIYGNAKGGYPRLFKLHGSVNWSRRDDRREVHSQVEVGSYVPNPMGTNDRPESFSLRGLRQDHSEVRAAEWCREREHIMVPPEILKPSTMEERWYKPQWQGAAAALHEADLVWFIGYSFPESDAFMKYFLSTSLFQNSHISQIAVINPDQDAIEHRASQLFKLPHHQSVFHGLPYSWKQIGFQDLLNGDVQKVRANASAQSSKLVPAPRTFGTR